MSDRDGELWSGLGGDALTVIWGVDPAGLAAERRDRLVAATITLRQRDADGLARMQAEVLSLPHPDRLDALVTRLLT